MKNRDFVYSDREIVEIRDALANLIDRLRLPIHAEPAAAVTRQTRYYPPAREVEGALGYCPKCDAPLSQGKYAKPYCYPCWSDKKNSR